MKKLLTLTAAFFVLGGFYQKSQAQVNVNALPTTYTQNFDSFGTANVNWTNNVTLPGWFIEKETNSVTTLIASAGGSGASEVYNYGVAADPDRTLGSIASGDESAFYGVQFTNSSSQTITNIVVTYDGEQWTKGNINPTTNSLQVFFRVGGSGFLADTNNVGWTAVSALNFDSPQTFLGAIQALNGNDATNRVAGITANIPVNVPPGQEVWLRWYDQNDPNAGGDHGLGIDNLSVEFQGPAFVLIFPLDATVELRKPKLTKTLKVPKKGFAIKGLIKTTNSVSEVSYFAFGGTNEPTNAVFKVAGKLKEFKKGKKFKQGYKYLFKHKGSGNKPGEGITESPVTLIVRASGTQGSNAASLNTNFVFTDVKIK
ncbi:MAG: hypothetical protein R3F23_00505 [Verrucomicrobiia bacterium]